MSDQNPTQAPVVIERVLNAPIDMVWTMWADAEHFKFWYGPMGASVPVAEMDVRVGGSRLVCMAMETPDGPMQMWFTGEYKVVDSPHRLVYTEAMCDEHGELMSPADMGMPGDEPMITEVEVVLTAEGDATRMVMTHHGVPAGSPGEGGWQMAFDKLVAALGG